MFYQLFGLSFWRHPFTAEDPLWCNATFLKSDEETNSSGMTWGRVNVQLIVFLGELCSSCCLTLLWSFFLRLLWVFVSIKRKYAYSDGHPGGGAVNSSGPDLVRLHVFLHVGLLSEGTAAHDTLKGLFTRVTVYLNVGQCLCSCAWVFTFFILHQNYLLFTF